MTLLHNDLKQFTGTMAYHKLSLFPVLATDGVAYFCEKAGAYWLFDEMAAFAVTHKDEEFIVVTVQVNGCVATIRYDDGNYKDIGGKVIDYTDLPTNPDNEWKFFISNYPTEKIIMLPSEY